MLHVDSQQELKTKRVRTDARECTLKWPHSQALTLKTGLRARLGLKQKPQCHTAPPDLPLLLYKLPTLMQNCIFFLLIAFNFLNHNTV